MDERLIELRKAAAESGNPVLREKSLEILLKTIRKAAPVKILEIGVNLGLTSVAMLSEVAGATLTGIEIDEEKKTRAEENFRTFNVKDRAKIFLGDAGEILPLLTGEYDFIFLDGPKGHYHEYLPDVLRILSVGGTLFADNVLFRGYVSGEVKTPHRFMTAKHSLEKFIKGITRNPNLKTEIIDVEDGISITEKLR